MSHATYCFLVNTDPEVTTDENLADDARSVIVEWAEKHCDENNWYQEMALVMANGRTVSLCEDGDWRGRDTLADEIASMPQETRWEWARLFSLKCVANEFRLGGRGRFSFGREDKPDEDFWNSFDALVKQILHEVPMRLSELWGEGSLIPEGEVPQEAAMGLFMKQYERSRLSTTMVRFLGTVRDGHVLFATDGTPYDYRAFDLTEYGSDPLSHAIVFVDIHT